MTGALEQPSAPRSAQDEKVHSTGKARPGEGEGLMRLPLQWSHSRMKTRIKLAEANSRLIQN